MKIIVLLKSLDKIGIKYQIQDINDYNKDIIFKIKGIEFKAGFDIKNNVIDDICREICYDNTDQQYQRRFFKNLNEVLRYTNF